MTLSIIILTYNEEKHIREAIATSQWADHILVFDSGSTDQTREIATAMGAHVLQNKFLNYAQQRNDALNAVDTEWVFFLDADERISPELTQEIQQTLQKPEHVGYHVPRHNYIFGKLTRHTGWYPDYQMRLLKRGQAHYDPHKQVHEVVKLAQGEPGFLQHPLIHHNYEDVRQFHQKQQRYTAFDARILYEAGVRPKIYTPYLQPFRHFKWRFFDLQGYQDGLHGLHLSLLMAWYEHRKYRQLRQMWTQPPPSQP